MSEPNEGPSEPRVVAIIQARLGSVRFPRKVLSEVRGQPLLHTMIERVRKAETLDGLVLAIPDTQIDRELEAFAESIGVDCFRGSEMDVLHRIAQAARHASADVVVRLTGDCPLVDPAVIDRCVRKVLSGEAEVCSTSLEFPDGFDVEAFRAPLLYEADQRAENSEDREHVTPYIRRQEAERMILVSPDTSFENIRITLDEKEDLVVLDAILNALPGNSFSAEEINQLAKTRPDIFQTNAHLGRNEGADMSSGQKMWGRAQKVIAGGNMLLSKRPDMHSPTKWPAYFSRAKGCKVWDLDDNEYIDFGFMGIGTNILGYGFEPVDEAVRKVISDGNLSTLNAPEEVLLAEKLCELHPWADMARFTRSGGEANAVATRIARAATGKDRIVFCGYHGWHDWYLAANLADDQALDDHLLPGLASAGVPRGLAGTAVPFVYNDLQSLEDAVRNGDVAAIYMEVERSTPPNPGFLEGVREIATRIGAVLVFDECTSGFRKNLGGIHMVHGVEPDIAVFGKTLGNGYAINAVIGRRAVMESASKTFISSTFWTERIGLAAGLEVLKQMEELDAPTRVHEIGLQVREAWGGAAATAGLNVEFAGIPSLTVVSVAGLSPLITKTVLTEAFLARGYLAGPAIYSSLPHESVLENQYRSQLGEVLGELGNKMDIEGLKEMQGEPLVTETFRRMV